MIDRVSSPRFANVWPFGCYSSSGIRNMNMWHNATQIVFSLYIYRKTPLISACGYKYTQPLEAHDRIHDIMPIF